MSSAETESERVRQLFNEKAGGWQGKYAPAGPLAHRIGLFESNLSRAVPKSAEVLEIGCGAGNLAAHLAQSGYRVTAGDIAEKMLESARRNFPAAAVKWTLLSTGREKLPFADAGFDAVVASSVLEYVDDPEFMLGECARVLRPRGVALLTVPNTKNAVRRIEQLAKPVARRLRGLPTPERLGSFMRYLELSKNRLPVARWEAMARPFGLEREVTAETAPETMVMLTFRRA